VVVGARGSRLAQAMVAEYLARLGGPCPVVKFKNRVVMTDGDRDRKNLLSEVSGESGAFSSQLEQELREGRIDVAVHSLKDLPTAMAEGLVLAVTPPRKTSMTRCAVRRLLNSGMVLGWEPGRRGGPPS
jgi:hydroxymethylbilane synthase